MQSAFWHEFTATVHSDVGKNPKKYKCRIIEHPAAGFAKNDLVHEDPIGCEHQRFAPGLNKAVYNFMHGIGTVFSVNDWFDFKIPKVSIKKSYVDLAINEKPARDEEQLKSRILWTGNRPQYVHEDSAKKGKGAGKSRFVLYNRTETFTLIASAEIGGWLNKIFDRFIIQNRELMRLEDLKQNYEKHFSSSFGSFLRSNEWKRLREQGLLLI
jgi:hypothetical protein